MSLNFDSRSVCFSKPSLSFFLVGFCVSLVGSSARSQDAPPQDRTSLEQLAADALTGDAVAAFNLGARYYVGRLVPKDLSAARKWWELAAEANQQHGQNALGYLFQHGLGVEPDIRKAMQLFTQASKSGLVEARFNLAYCQLLHSKDSKTEQAAFKSLNELIDASATEESIKAAAAHLVGFCHENAIGTTADPNAAQTSYERAVDFGREASKLALAKLYASGAAKPRSAEDEFAVHIFASDRGVVDSQYRVAVMYRTGVGVGQDESTAMEWFEAAANGGSISAATNLGFMYRNGLGKEQNIDQAVRWYLVAAEKDDRVAQYNLGYLHFQGLVPTQDEEEANGDSSASTTEDGNSNTSPNYAKAMEWYQKAAIQDHAAAIYTIGYMFEGGLGVEQDFSQAANWYQKAAELGYANAQNNLAYLFQYGRGVDQSDADAFAWYSKAAELGNATAQNNLGLLYRDGKGTAPNVELAREWLRKAAEQGNDSAKQSLELLDADATKNDVNSTGS